MHKILLLFLSLGMLACNKASNQKKYIPEDLDHRQVMAGHRLLYTQNMTRKGIMFSLNKPPKVLWDIETAPCPDGWHLPNDDEWAELSAVFAKNLTNKKDKVHGIQMSYLLHKNTLPDGIIKSDSIYLIDYAVRAYSGKSKCTTLNLNIQPKEWKTTEYQSTIEAYKTSNTKFTPKAYVLDTNRTPPRLARYSCFCVPDQSELK